jgi:DNA-binding beta-propeller fold protein YncE
MTAVRLAVLCIATVAMASAAQAAGSGYHITDRIAGPDGGWDYASYDAGRDRVLVARTTAVTAVDLKTRVVNPAFAPAARGHAAFAVKGGTEVAITNGAANTVTFVDAATGALLATVATGSGPDDAIIEPKTGLLLVMDHKGGTVTLVDPKAHKAVGTIAVGGILEAVAADGTGRVFVNVEDKNQIAVLDIPGRKVTARYELAGCEGPTGIAYAAADKLLIAACDGVAEVVAANTGKVVRQIKIGDGADGVAYDARRKLAFIPAGMAGTLSVISVAHGDATLIDTIETQKGARTLALDTVGGRVFLPTAKYVIPTDGGRPTPTPGTFELLVIGK